MYINYTPVTRIYHNVLIYRTARSGLGAFPGTDGENNELKTLHIPGNTPDKYYLTAYPCNQMNSAGFHRKKQQVTRVFTR